MIKQLLSSWFHIEISRYGTPDQFLIDIEYEMIIKPSEAMLDKYATDSFIIELGAIPDNHDIRVEFSYFMELRKVKDENEFETHRNYFQGFMKVESERL